MASQDSRPVNLDLTKFSFPITAIASITHRACAVISWVGIAFLLYLVSSAGGSFVEFADSKAMLQNSPLLQFLSWGFLSAFGYYCLGTAKHIIQDFGYFEDFEGGQVISWAALGGAVLISIATGVAIWA